MPSIWRGRVCRVGRMAHDSTDHHDLDPCERPAQGASRPVLRKLSSRLFPMIRWSCTVIPIVPAAATICRVISMSAALGVGSPEGWLWTIHMVRITC